VQSFRDLPRTKHRKKTQERLTQARIFFDISLPVVPTQRQHLRKQGTEIVAMPVAIRKGTNLTCKLFNPLR